MPAFHKLTCSQDALPGIAVGDVVVIARVEPEGAGGGGGPSGRAAGSAAAALVLEVP